MPTNKKEEDALRHWRNSPPKLPGEYWARCDETEREPYKVTVFYALHGGEDGKQELHVRDPDTGVHLLDTYLGQLSNLEWALPVNLQQVWPPKQETHLVTIPGLRQLYEQKLKERAAVQLITTPTLFDAGDLGIALLKWKDSTVWTVTWFDRIVTLDGVPQREQEPILPPWTSEKPTQKGRYMVRRTLQPDLKSWRVTVAIDRDGVLRARCAMVMAPLDLYCEGFGDLEWRRLF